MTAPPDGYEVDRAALVALYNATGGTHWARRDGWLTGRPVGEWYGVTTDGNGRTVRLDLSYNQLTGEIPPGLANLANLRGLDLSNNQLTGEIPPGLANLANLRGLDLSNNQLTGEIPPELGNLANLDVLDLSNNQLTGEMPHELGNLTNLDVLDLSNNQLTGEMPPELGNLTNLAALGLFNNQLTGEMPHELGNLANLIELYLYDNQLTGEMPHELGNLGNLTVLDLSKNQLTGEIPPELGNLGNLTVLDLRSNQLTGEIPPGLGNLANLRGLDLNSNQLTGEIPPGLGNLANLRVLGLSKNQLTGEMPPELGNLSNLSRLYLYHNRLAGEMPPELGNLSNLSRLYLYDNRLTGEIPPGLGNVAYLTVLDLSNNQLTGEIPPGLGNLAYLTVLDLSNNQLTREIPPELAGLSKLSRLSLEGNKELDGSTGGDAGTTAGNTFNLDVGGATNGAHTSRAGDDKPPRILPQPSVGGVARGLVGDELPWVVATATTDNDTADGAAKDDEATFHLFAVVPIELYNQRVATHIQGIFEELAEWEKYDDKPFHGERPRGTSTLLLDDPLLDDMGMPITETYTRTPDEVDGQDVQVHAVFIRTAMCLVLRTSSTLKTGRTDAQMYRRIKWALSVADKPPDWLDDILPYNPQGALYRAVWMWIYQRYARNQWRDASRSIAETHAGTIVDAAKAQFEGEQSVDLIQKDKLHIVTFSALELGAEKSDGGLAAEAMWREHFPTTARALDILNAVDDDVSFSKEAIYSAAFKGGAYRNLVQTNIYLRQLLRSAELSAPGVALAGEGFDQIAGETVQKLSSFDLDKVRAGLIEHRLMKHQQHPVESDWHDLQDNDEHVLLLTEQDTVTMATANSKHIDQLVLLEIALQSAWNKYEQLSWNLKDILEDNRRQDIDEDRALRELSELALAVAGWRTRLSGWSRVALQHLRDASKLDENIRAFLKAAEEYVRHAGVEREKKFHRVATVAGLALAAIVLGEITISIAGTDNSQRVEESVAVLVALGAALVSPWLVRSTFEGWSNGLRFWGTWGGALFCGLMVVAAVDHFFELPSLWRTDWNWSFWLWGDFWWPWPGLPVFGLTAGWVMGCLLKWFEKSIAKIPGAVKRNVDRGWARLRAAIPRVTAS